jgi:hypothetical protein
MTLRTTVVLGLLVFFCSSAWAQDNVPKCKIYKPATTLVRKNASRLLPNARELQDLATAVTVMKQKNWATDPTSWFYQAAMHGTYFDVQKVAKSNQIAPPPQWNTCQHGTYFFLAWHRMYLHFFERIVRSASRDPNFALPYWNYGNDKERQLPATFRDPHSLLFVAERSEEMNIGYQLPSLSENGIDLGGERALALVDFSCPDPSAPRDSSFGGNEVSQPTHSARNFGQLEDDPHNAIHDYVGGNSNGWMGDVDLAAQDPVFWIHHANIDRLWNVWIKSGNGRANLIHDDVLMNTKLYFFDETGSQCWLSGRDVLDTAKDLGYSYEEEAPVQASPKSACPKASETGSAMNLQTLAITPGTERIELAGKPVRVKLGGAEFHPLFMSPNEKPVQLLLTLEHIEFRTNPGLTYQVFLNLGSDEHPDVRSDNYVGGLHFFGLKQNTEDGNVVFDITRVVEKLRAKNRWSGFIEISLIPIGLEPPPGQVEHKPSKAVTQPVKVTVNRISLTAR